MKCRKGESGNLTAIYMLWHTVAGSGRFSIISQLLLTYFAEISRLFLVSHLFHLFPRNFLVISHFSIISQPFLAGLFLNYNILYDIAHVIIFV